MYIAPVFVGLCISIVAAACTSEVPITVQVPVTVEVPATVEVPVTWEVEVTRQVEVTREVEATREVPVTRIAVETREVPVTREVEVTRAVPVTREVAVTREVPVTRVVVQTREVEVTRSASPPRPNTLCADYPYMLLLGEAERDLHKYSYDLFFGSGDDLEPWATENFRDMEARLLSTQVNQSQICGLDASNTTRERWEIRSWEGWAVCESVYTEAEIWFDTTDDEWNELPVEFRRLVNRTSQLFSAYCLGSP